LRKRGARVLRLVRDESQRGPDAVYWSPESGDIDADALNGVDAIRNFVGEPIGADRWSPERKKRIRDSPSVLKGMGFEFQYPELAEALRAIADDTLKPQKN
jgi:NAD dependent epimerase/dehydratase family enzyme